VTGASKGGDACWVIQPKNVLRGTRPQVAGNTHLYPSLVVKRPQQTSAWWPMTQASTPRASEATSTSSRQRTSEL
jgi:hypothetical protein